MSKKNNLVLYKNKKIEEKQVPRIGTTNLIIPNIQNLLVLNNLVQPILEYSGISHVILPKISAYLIHCNLYEEAHIYGDKLINRMSSYLFSITDIIILLYTKPHELLKYIQKDELAKLYDISSKFIIKFLILVNLEVLRGTIQYETKDKIEDIKTMHHYQKIEPDRQDINLIGLEGNKKLEVLSMLKNRFFTINRKLLTNIGIIQAEIWNIFTNEKINTIITYNDLVKFYIYILKTYTRKEKLREFFYEKVEIKYKKSSNDEYHDIDYIIDIIDNYPDSIENTFETESDKKQIYMYICELLGWIVYKIIEEIANVYNTKRKYKAETQIEKPFEGFEALFTTPVDNITTKIITLKKDFFKTKVRTIISKNQHVKLLNALNLMVYRISDKFIEDELTPKITLIPDTTRKGIFYLGDNPYKLKTRT